MEPLKKYLPYVILVILVVAVFHQALFAQYVLWDDDALITNNVLLKMPFAEAFKTATSVYYHGDYFPLTLMSYWFDAQVFGMNPLWQHLENLFLHLLSVCLLFSFLSSFTKDRRISFIISLLFAIHPLQTESVMWLSERKSLLSAVFTFLSLIFYQKTYTEVGRVRNYILALVCFVLAGMAKATGLFIPILFLLIDTFVLKKDLRRISLKFIPMALLAGAMMLVRVQAYSASVTEMSGVLWDSQRLLILPVITLNAVAFYLQKFFLPMNFSPIYSDFALTPVTVVLAFIVAIMGIVALWALWRKKNFYFLFFILWFVLFLLPVLQIIPRVNYVNDRYMYLPMIGFAGALMYSIRWLSSKHGIAWIGLWSLFLIFQSYSFSKFWLDNRSLWSQAVLVTPESAIAHNNLGLEFQSSGDFSKAVEQYNLVLSGHEHIEKKLLAYVNLATVYMNSRYEGYNQEKAAALLTEGIQQVRRQRDSYELRANLGMLYRSMGKPDEARNILLDLLKDLNTESDYRFQWLKPIVENQLQLLQK